MTRRARWLLTAVAVTAVHAVGVAILATIPPSAPTETRLSLQTRIEAAPRPIPRPAPAPSSASAPSPAPAVSAPPFTPAPEPTMESSAEAAPVPVQNAVPAPPAPGSGEAPSAPEPPSAPVYRSADQVTVAPVVPEAAVRAALRYPERARRQRIQATVVLDLLIDRDGVIRQVDVVSDPGWGFAAATLALVGLVAVPGRLDGEPVAVRLRYPVRFLLP